MSLLSVVQDAAELVAQKRPTSVIGTTDLAASKFFGLLKQLCDDLRDDRWRELERRATIAGIAGRDSYAAPVDFDAQIMNTVWNEDTNQRLFGPISAQDQQLY